MNTTQQLQAIATQLRDINKDSAADAERDIQWLTGDAARLIQPHWETIVSKAGIDWRGASPFPAAEHRDPQTDMVLWSVVWQTIAGVLWSKLRGHYWPGRPQFTTIEHKAATKKQGALTVSTATRNANQASDYAVICDTVADWLTIEKETPPEQPGHFENKIPPEDVQEINRMMKLKRWQGKNPIDACRAYIRAKHKNANEQFIESQAQSLKRKRNRY